MNHALKIKNSKPNAICQLHGEDANGFPVYYFMRVEPLKKKAFEKALSGHNIDLKQYGQILRSGYGQPTLDDHRYMKDKHDYDVQD